MIAEPWLEEIMEALKNGAVSEFDERGLIPLPQARKLVCSVDEFRRGKGEMINGGWYWKSDQAWAAILSLEDADEFLREALRIQWFFHPRGGRNTALLSRYGKNILPWLKTFLRADGLFVNVPWCVKDCLMAMDSEEVFELIWHIHAVTDGTEGFPGPFATDDPGDADLRMDSGFNKKAPAFPDADADAWVHEWIRLHPETGMQCIYELSAKGNARALQMLGAIH